MTTEVVSVIDLATDVVVGAATRAHMRRHHLAHRAVYIVVFSPAGEILLHQRTAWKDIYPSYWDLAFGGVMVAGEEYDHAAQRELLEEAGLSDPIESLFVIRFDDPTVRVAGRVYRCVTSEVPTLQESEVARTEWITPAELRRWTEEKPFCPDSLSLVPRLLARYCPSVGAALAVD